VGPIPLLQKWGPAPIVPLRFMPVVIERNLVKIAETTIAHTVLQATAVCAYELENKLLLYYKMRDLYVYNAHS